MEEVAMNIVDLTKYFDLGRGLKLFGKTEVLVKAVDHVTFDVRSKEILALVGESGCGKTTIGFLIVRLEDPTSGHIMFEGIDIAALRKKELKTFRKNVQMIFQDPYSSLNPRLTVQQTVAEPLINHKLVVTADEAREEVLRALEDVGLKEEYLERFPHELSGGERQRVAIARALVVRPKFIVADEPVSMLDVSIRAGVMRLMLDLREKYDIPFLFITHDLASARFMADRIAVMYLGKIVELAKSEEVIFDAKHPYTKVLLDAVPVGDPTRERVPLAIRGEIPSPIDIPTGCRFHPRCPWAEDICTEEEPEMVDVGEGHLAACHFAVEGKEWARARKKAKEEVEEGEEIPVAQKKPMQAVGGVLAIVFGIVLVVLMGTFWGYNFLTVSLGGGIIAGTAAYGLIAIYQGLTGKEVKWGRR